MISFKDSYTWFILRVKSTPSLLNCSKHISSSSSQFQQGHSHCKLTFLFQNFCVISRWNVSRNTSVLRNTIPCTGIVWRQTLRKTHRDYCPMNAETQKSQLIFPKKNNGRNERIWLHHGRIHCFGQWGRPRFTTLYRNAHSFVFRVRGPLGPWSPPLCFVFQTSVTNQRKMSVVIGNVQRWRNQRWYRTWSFSLNHGNWNVSWRCLIWLRVASSCSCLWYLPWHKEWDVSFVSTPSKR